MDIKELDKKQLILLTLLITFIVSIATGIVTVSLMNQMPKSVPQTINNVIQRTIEKVTTVETPIKSDNATSDKTKEDKSLIGDGDAIVNIYSVDTKIINNSTSTTGTTAVDSTQPGVTTDIKALGQGIIISDVGLVLVDSSILNESLVYKVILNKTDFDATVLKKFGNGFTILKLSEKKPVVKTPEKTDTTKTIQ
ncbi:MAG: hypothetical protein WCW54_03035 [Candidatus Paceibacterota bacterium]